LTTKKKRVVVYKDELTGDKTLKLESLPEGETTRTKKVDYEKLVLELDNKVITVRGIQKLMLKCSRNKPKVYYSEVLRAIKALEQQNLITYKRLLDTTTNIIYYEIHSTTAS